MEGLQQFVSPGNTRYFPRNTSIPLSKRIQNKKIHRCTFHCRSGEHRIEREGRESRGFIGCACVLFSVRCNVMRCWSSPVVYRSSSQRLPQPLGPCLTSRRMFRSDRVQDYPPLQQREIGEDQYWLSNTQLRRRPGYEWRWGGLGGVQRGQGRCMMEGGGVWVEKWPAGLTIGRMGL